MCYLSVSIRRIDTVALYPVFLCSSAIIRCSVCNTVTSKPETMISHGNSALWDKLLNANWRNGVPKYWDAWSSDSNEVRHGQSPSRSSTSRYIVQFDQGPWRSDASIVMKTVCTHIRRSVEPVMEARWLWICGMGNSPTRDFNEVTNSYISCALESWIHGILRTWRSIFSLFLWLLWIGCFTESFFLS